MLSRVVQTLLLVLGPKEHQFQMVPPGITECSVQNVQGRPRVGALLSLWAVVSDAATFNAMTIPSPAGN